MLAVAAGRHVDVHSIDSFAQAKEARTGLKGGGIL